MIFESSFKAERVGMDERWFANTFQLSKATDENNPEVATCGGFMWQNTY